MLAGLPAVRLVLEEMNLDVELATGLEDGQRLQAGRAARCNPGFHARPADGGTADTEPPGKTLRDRLVDAGLRGAGGRHAGAVYDTRKTTPGWRRLEKSAVRCGGGWNHRTGLFDAVLIKDNHLAQSFSAGITAADAVRRARQFLATYQPERSGEIVEIEVDTLEQLDEVLGSQPDVVLLDNMSLDQLREAVRRQCGGFRRRVGSVRRRTYRQRSHNC